MPKKVIEGLLAALESDIRGNCAVGQRYKSVRQIALAFNVCLQTAQRAVKIVCGKGMLTARRKSGIVVRALYPQAHITGREVILLSNNPDERFNTGFLNGVMAALAPEGLTVRLMVNKMQPTNTLDFGDVMVRMHEQYQALGIIALYFNDAALPFYHALSKGINLIGDIAFANLPVLPVVQTDNALHARTAGSIMKQWNKSDVLVTAFWPEENNRRFVAFKEGFLHDNPGVKVSYVNLGQEQSRGMLHNFFKIYTKNKGVFSGEYSATHLISSYFYQHNIDVEKNLIIYDCEDDRFEFRGLKPVAGVAPSFKDLGRRLGEKLLHKIRNGQWELPLIEKI